MICFLSRKPTHDHVTSSQDVLAIAKKSARPDDALFTKTDHESYLIRKAEGEQIQPVGIPLVDNVAQGLVILALLRDLHVV